jgi:hypothetical protein
LTDLRYIHAFVDHTGRARFYFRRLGKRTPLLGLPGSREFMDAYAACLADQKPPRTRRPAASDGTFAALATLYYGSPQYLALSNTSRGNYRRVIDCFLEEHGHRRVDQMRREHLDIINLRLSPSVHLVRGIALDSGCGIAVDPVQRHRVAQKSSNPLQQHDPGTRLSARADQ